MLPLGTPPIGQDITEAVLALRQGRLLGFPTETVYGLGADALNEVAVSAVFAAKGRPVDHPLIVHIPELAALAEWAIDIPPVAWDLAKAFWPGPLTLVLKKHPRVPAVVTGGQDSIALRIPQHPVCLRLLRAFGSGMVGPSANRYQRISPTTATDVAEELGDKLTYILDGGPCAVGIESTIVSFGSAGEIQILRQGAIPPSALAVVVPFAPTVSGDNARLPRVPGNSTVHYAPEKPVFMADINVIVKTLEDLKKQPQSENKRLAVFAFSPKPSIFSAWVDLDWQIMPQDPQQYQQQLYTRLRRFDKSPAISLWIEAVPYQADAWLAIEDRLQRVAAKTSPGPKTLPRLFKK